MKLIVRMDTFGRPVDAFDLRLRHQMLSSFLNTIHYENNN
jgi:hypothetical protein